MGQGGVIPSDWVKQVQTIEEIRHTYVGLKESLEFYGWGGYIDIAPKETKSDEG